MKIVITPKKSFLKTIKQVTEKKDLFFLLTKKEIYLRYKYKTIGIFWGVFQPLMLAFIISLSLGKVASHIIGNQHYFLSVFCGYIFWGYFSSTVGKAMNSLFINRLLVKNAAFPHILLPLSVLGVGWIDFMTSLLVAICIALYFGLSIQFLPVLFICMGIMMITTISVGSLFSILYVQFADIREVLSFFITALFYLTPIIYPVRIIPSQYHTYLYINPMVGVIETAKATLLDPKTISWEGLSISFISSLIILLTSLYIFTAMDKTVSDIL